MFVCLTSQLFYLFSENVWRKSVYTFRKKTSLWSRLLGVIYEVTVGRFLFCHKQPFALSTRLHFSVCSLRSLQAVCGTPHCCVSVSCLYISVISGRYVILKKAGVGRRVKVCCQNLLLLNFSTPWSCAHLRCHYVLLLPPWNFNHPSQFFSL